MSLHPQLQAGGFFGVPATPGLTRSLAASEVLAAARKRPGGAPCLACVGDDLKTSRSLNRFERIDVRRAPVVLTRRNSYATSLNTKAAWAGSVGASDYEQLPNPFGRNAAGLLYNLGTPSTPGRFTGPAWGAKQSLACRFYLFKPDFDEVQTSLTVHSLMWGEQGGGRPEWRLELYDGKPSLKRLSSVWTQSEQLALEALQSFREPSPAQEASIETRRQALYLAEWDISGGASGFASMMEFRIEADDTGAVWVTSGKEVEQIFEQTDILALRQTATLWHAGPLRVGCNQGAFIWQVGTVATTRTSKLRLPDIAFNASSAGWLIDTAHYAPAGTSITTGLDAYTRQVVNGQTTTTEETGVYSPYVVLTSDGARTPVLHDVFFSVQGGERTGAVVGFEEWFLDSDDYNASDGSAPISDVSIQWEGEHRALTVDFELHAQNGRLLASLKNDANNDFLSDRLARFKLGEKALLGAGLVQAPSLNNATNVPPGGLFIDPTGPDTSIALSLYDFWFVADEWLLWELPVGDGADLGTYIRLLLTFPGFKDVELAGIPAATGVVLPVAALGERPAIQPAFEQSLGEFLRALLEEYAPDWILDAYTGTWRLRPRGTTIRAAFALKGAPRPAQLPAGVPMFEILEPLDILRDSREVKNAFRGQGAENTPGAGALSWNVHELQSNPNQRGHSGRIKRERTFQNDAWRDRASVERGMRRKVRMSSRPGRWFGFTAPFCLHLALGDDLLAPGDHVLIVGKLTSEEGQNQELVVRCEIERIDGGNIERGNDDLRFVVREFVRFV